MNRAAHALFVLRAHTRLAHISAERDAPPGPRLSNPVHTSVTPKATMPTSAAATQSPTPRLFSQRSMSGAQRSVTSGWRWLSS